MSSLSRKLSSYSQVFSIDEANNQIILANTIVFADGTKQNTSAESSGFTQAAYNKANTANLTAQAAFDKANTGGSAVDQYARNTSNVAFNTANAAYNAANVVVSTNDLIVAGRDANNNIDGLKDKDGNYISELASYTWSQFTSASFDLTYNRRVLVIDKGGDDESHSLWEIIPTATAGNKRKLLSEPIYFATLNTAPYANQWKGLRIRCGNVGEGDGAILRSDGTYWRPESSKLIILSNAITHVHNTTTLTTQEVAYNVILPVDANGKSLLQENDVICINEFTMSKTGTSDIMQMSQYIGTKGNNSDTLLMTASASANTHLTASATNNRYIRRADVSGNSVFERTTTDAFFLSTSGTGSRAGPDNLTFTIDTSSSTIYFSVGYRIISSTGDSNLKAHYCEIEMIKGF